MSSSIYFAPMNPRRRFQVGRPSRWCEILSLPRDMHETDLPWLQGIRDTVESHEEKAGLDELMDALRTYHHVRVWPED